MRDGRVRVPIPRILGTTRAFDSRYLLKPPMPEIQFKIQWPDGSPDLCYSPSLVVKEYFMPEQSYALNDFVERSRTALTIASDRVKAKYGMPCGMAMRQLSYIEQKAIQYRELPQPQVRVLEFLE